MGVKMMASAGKKRAQHLLSWIRGFQIILNSW